MKDIKQALEERALAEKNQPVKLTKSMTIVDMVRALEPEIRRALPAVLTPERFTRMALSAINNTPELADCTPMSFIAAGTGTKHASGTGLPDPVQKPGRAGVPVSAGI